MAVGSTSADDIHSKEANSSDSALEVDESYGKTSLEVSEADKLITAHDTSQSENNSNSENIDHPARISTEEPEATGII